MQVGEHILINMPRIKVLNHEVSTVEYFDHPLANKIYKVCEMAENNLLLEVVNRVGDDDEIFRFNYYLDPAGEAKAVVVNQNYVNLYRDSRNYDPFQGVLHELGEFDDEEDFS